MELVSCRGNGSLSCSTATLVEIRVAVLSPVFSWWEPVTANCYTDKIWSLLGGVPKVIMPMYLTKVGKPAHWGWHHFLCGILNAQWRKGGRQQRASAFWKWLWYDLLLPAPPPWLPIHDGVFPPTAGQIQPLPFLSSHCQNALSQKQTKKWS